MTNETFSCAELDARLSDYLEESLDADARAALEAHGRACVRCGALLAGIRGVTRAARSLPDLAPERDLWSGIAARIDAPVVPLSAARSTARAGRRSPAWLVAAAAALVVMTAGITWMAARSSGGRTAPAVVAAAPTTAAPAAGSAVASGAATAVPPLAAPGSARATSPALVSTGAARRLPAEQVYDQEITRLVAILRDRRSQLDTSTVRVITKNLLIIDEAIAQSRAALARDPNSRFLSTQLNSALDQKVELLRTAAFLPARS